MKQLFILISCCVSVVSLGNSMVLPKNQVKTEETEQPVWTLVWADNFDKDGLPDPAIWGYEEGYIRNHEAQYYTVLRPENARVEDGSLIIEARKDNWEKKPVTSASVNTYGKKSILYGRIEVRAKLPTGKGTWPAIWMLGENIKNGTGWPLCGEIDIMENVGFDPDIIHANIHTKAYNHVRHTNKGDKITVEEPYNDFHVYALEWFEDHMDFFVDDKKYFSYENEGTGEETWPFDKPQYLIINLAIGVPGVDNKVWMKVFFPKIIISIM